MQTHRKWDLFTSAVVVTVLLSGLHALTAGRVAAIAGEELASSSDSSFSLGRGNRVLIRGVAPGQVVSVC